MTESVRMHHDDSLRRSCLLAGAVFAFAATGHSHANDAFESHVRPYLEQHCFDCHGSETQEADRRFDLFAGTIETRESADLLADVLDQLNRGEMPPEDRPRPENDQTQRVVDWLRERRGARA